MRDSLKDSLKDLQVLMGFQTDSRSVILKGFRLEIPKAIQTVIHSPMDLDWVIQMVIQTDFRSGFHLEIQMVIHLEILKHLD